MEATMIPGQNLKSLYESLGPTGFAERMENLLKSGKVKPEEFSLREIAEATCGPNWVRRLNARNAPAYSWLDVREAGEAVDVTAFAHITGQIVYTKIHQGWNEGPFIGDTLFETVPTNFDGEKIPGIGQVKGEGRKIRPGMPYPESGFGEQYWETPSTDKYGQIVSITKEAVFFDRTGLVLRQAQQNGKRLRMNKEVRQLACFGGVTVTLASGETFNGNNHKWNGTTYNTYDTSSNAIGINSKSGVELVDWTDVEEAELLYADLTDPDTGRPIDIMPNTLVVMPFKKHTARRIVSATELRSGDITTGSGMQTVGSNTLDNYNVISSQLLYALIVNSGVSAANAKHWWFLTEAKRGFWYMENWPLTVIPAPANNDAEFERDIVARWKASERGVPYSADPRATVKMYNS